MWTIFATVEISKAEAWRQRNVLRSGLGGLMILIWRRLAALRTFLRWLPYGVQTNVFISENTTVSLCGEDVHSVGSNDVETQ